MRLSRAQGWAQGRGMRSRAIDGSSLTRAVGIEQVECLPNLLLLLLGELGLAALALSTRRRRCTGRHSPGVSHTRPGRGARHPSAARRLGVCVSQGAARRGLARGAAGRVSRLSRGRPPRPRSPGVGARRPPEWRGRWAQRTHSLSKASDRQQHHSGAPAPNGIPCPTWQLALTNPARAACLPRGRARSF